MVSASLADHMLDVGLLELSLLLAAATYVIQVTLDTMGWSRTSRTLRTENEDLIRRNKELEDTIRRLEEKVADLQEKLEVLGSELSELRSRDQGAVLDAINEHEHLANKRAEKYVQVLDSIRVELHELLTDVVPKVK